MLPDINRATGFVSEGFLGEEWEIRCWLHILHQELCVGLVVFTSHKHCDSLLSLLFTINPSYIATTQQTMSCYTICGLIPVQQYYRLVIYHSV